MKTYLCAVFLVLFSAFTLAENATAQEKSSLPLPAPGNVTLSLDEYNRLVALASKPTKKVDLPPLPYAVKRADLKLHVVNESVLGTIQLEGEIFHKGTVKIPLTNGMTILDARQEGKALPLEQEGGTHTAILGGPADFSVTLDTGLPLGIDAGRASFTVPVPAAGSDKLTLTVPGDHTNIRINPGLITSRTSVNGQTTIEATLVPGQTANVWWTTREVVAPKVPREVRFLSDVKTLVSVSESDLKIAALANITVIQGEPTQFAMEIPAGYEVTNATGPSLESSEVQQGSPEVLILNVTGTAQRNHEFLISMERSIQDSRADVPFLTFRETQRETGEVLVEGAGTMELTAKEGGNLKRMDVKETNPYLRSLAHSSLHAAFRYHRQPAEAPTLALEWVRFPDSSVLAAVADRAIVTTLVTSQGKSLTEVKLVVKNQAQPFLKVALPAGASILSAEVDGEKVKPVQGSDGDRVPLLRPGFHPTGPYAISFVFLHSGAPFAKKGGSELSLPKFDLPIGLLQWEVFLPEQYKVKDFGGDAIATALLPPTSANINGLEEDDEISFAPLVAGGDFKSDALLPGQLGGFIVDPSGSGVPNVQISVVHSDTGTAFRTVTDQGGHWLVSNLPSGRVRVTANAQGFNGYTQDINYDGSRPSRLSFGLRIAAATETVTITSGADTINRESQRIEKEARKAAEARQYAASSNVTSLQRRVAGVLPISVDVPRAGNSYRFVRPLVLDEETKVSFTYKSK